MELQNEPSYKCIKQNYTKPRRALQSSWFLFSQPDKIRFNTIN
jgi:hypothetical protein